MKLESYRQELMQAWKATKARLEQAQAAAKEATVEGLRIEGALQMLARLEQEQDIAPDREMA